MSYFKTKFIHSLAAGAAIFSMFFGAGNAIFPIQLGVNAGSSIIYSLIGLMLTGIGGPLLGLVTALYFKGDSLKFYSRWGLKLGYFFILLSLALLGPFCVLPRCYIVAFTAIESLIPQLNNLLFFIIFSCLSLLCTIKKNKLLNILGTILSPVLLICLCTIVINSLNSDSLTNITVTTPHYAFSNGISAGYDTMDLIAAIIFSGSIWSLLSLQHKEEQKVHSIAWHASLIGGAILGLIYCGLAIAASRHADMLSNTAPEYLLATLAKISLNPYFYFIANLTIAIACFTTVVSLIYSISRIIYKEVLSKKTAGKLTEQKLITIITFLSTFFALLEFSTIQNILHPILNIAYPVIIVLTVLNLYDVTFNNKKLSFQKTKEELSTT